MTTYWHKIKQWLGFLFLGSLPKKFVSYLAGLWFGLKLPRWLVRYEVLLFSKVFNVNLRESVKEPGDFVTFQDFFTRKIDLTRRPIGKDLNSIISPCDGAFGASGTVENNVMIQAKNIDYSLETLIEDVRTAELLDKGSYTTFYLAPKDYHRFHAPFDLIIKKEKECIGKYNPVNKLYSQNVPDLYSQNVRKVYYLGVKGEERTVGVLVAVGAFMVGKIQSSPLKPSKCLQKGEELGWFEFGSTIVLVLAKNFGCLNLQNENKAIKMGQTIGYLEKSYDIND